MQFNGKTIFLQKQMHVYVDILKNWRLTSSAGYRPTSLGYIVRIPPAKWSRTVLECSKIILESSRTMF